MRQKAYYIMTDFAKFACLLIFFFKNFFKKIFANKVNLRRGQLLVDLQVVVWGCLCTSRADKPINKHILHLGNLLLTTYLLYVKVFDFVNFFFSCLTIRSN